MDIASRLDLAMKEAGLESQSALSRASGIPQPTINRILKGVGKKGPEAHTLVKLALACNVTFEWLHEGIEPKSRTSPTMTSNVSPGPDIRGQVPLISWVTAGAFCESPDNFAPGDAEKWLSCPVPHGKYTYCLRVVGKSMDNGDDGYRDGEIIFVDPDVETMPGRDAIIRTPNGESTFKRLKQDVDGLYLQALNPRWEPNYFKMPEGSHICGIVIFAGRER